MGRTKKTETSNAEEALNAEIQINVAPAETQVSDEQLSNDPGEVKETSKVSKTKKSEEPTDKEKELMKLYPHYEKVWITPNGFVHPECAPEYMRKGAKLLKNLFYNK